MRWSVKLNDMTGDVLAETLGAAGFDLDVDMLSSDVFEALEDWGAVADAARELSQKVHEIARLNPDIVIGFTPGPVFVSVVKQMELTKRLLSGESCSSWSCYAACR